jgi:lysophospholipase L1-like esterase
MNFRIGSSYFRPTCNVKGTMARIRLSIVAYALLAAASPLPTQWAAAQDAPAAMPNAPLPTPAVPAPNAAPAAPNTPLATPDAPAAAQDIPVVAPDAPMQISWHVRNRFRLFREERDFLLQTDSGRGRSVLASERALELLSDGRGWARNTVNRLCIDLMGRVSEPCTRDNVKESYLTPVDHPVTVRLAGQIPVGATCAWAFNDGETPLRSTLDCTEPVNLRVRYGRTTVATVDVSSGPAPAQRLSTPIAVRDLFIAGLGDSIASGEGNPDREIALADEGFCFRFYLGGAGAQYYRPSRAGYKGGRACEAPDTLQAWQRKSALWFNSACHRSLYSYQTRTALALAVRYTHIAVTYLPLACTGATIPDGLFGPQRARECPPIKSGSCPGRVDAQLTELRAALDAAKRRQPDRKLDLILLSIGGNDIYFSGLVANVIVDTPTERVLFKRTGVMASLEDSRAALARDLPQSFRRLREALKPLVGGDLSHVVYVSYANPTLTNGGVPCPGGRAGFDIHPSFNADPQRLANVSRFVDQEFLPQLKALALCQSGVLCRDPVGDRMTFVDAHQVGFADHGFCARAESDPEFDRECFSAQGESFNADIVTAASQPMLCGRSASEYRAYLPRARWIRDANDSYFAAMTYPQGLPASSQPADIHDATWGVLSAVYGGALHPSAEGHAAMADAALPAVASVLRLDTAVPEVIQEPAAPLVTAPDEPLMTAPDEPPAALPPAAVPPAAVPPGGGLN